MPRIAFFPDSFHEVNGVAHTARNFAAFAERRGIPMLCVCAGERKGELRRGSVQRLELPRSRWALPMEQDLAFDPLFLRHLRAVRKALQAFRPDVLHITGPSELGILGAWFAWRMHLPLVASWHTNVHEYAGRRAAARLRHLPRLGHATGRLLEAGALSAATRFYRLARVLYAPNPQLCALLQARTGRPCVLMQRGVDAELFSPSRRSSASEGSLVLGFVGRLSVEKNVDLLPVVHRALQQQGMQPHWLIVGHGTEHGSLAQQLGTAATFTGVLRGQALAQAYARMDLLVFPSHTDTFGNVVLEALASGTPAVVTPDGGPAHIVQDGVTGVIRQDAEFALAIADLAKTPGRLQSMRLAARAYALGCSWDAVFERVLAAYPST